MSISYRRAMIALIAVGTLAACNKPAPADAYGNFEAEEVVVSAEVSGPLARFAAAEGARIASDSVVGQIDTVTLSLERAQLKAQREGLVARRLEGASQLQGLQSQHEIARRTRERIDRLFASQAATAMQRDQVERDERLLSSQVSGARDGLLRADADIAALDARLASLQDRVGRAQVRNPVSGTVLVTYVRTGEMINAGQALYRIANLDTLTLRLYVTGAQLPTVRIGAPVQVHVDGSADSLRTYPGVIAWIADKAEFTPTPVQTRDDRGDLVYAVKVRVPNAAGELKVGMPADINLGATVAAAPARKP